MLHRGAERRSPPPMPSSTLFPPPQRRCCISHQASSALHPPLYLYITASKPLWLAYSDCDSASLSPCSSSRQAPNPVHRAFSPALADPPSRRRRPIRLHCVCLLSFSRGRMAGFLVCEVLVRRGAPSRIPLRFIHHTLASCVKDSHRPPMPVQRPSPWRLAVCYLTSFQAPIPCRALGPPSFPLVSQAQPPLLLAWIFCINSPLHYPAVEPGPPVCLSLIVTPPSSQFFGFLTRVLPSSSFPSQTQIASSSLVHAAVLRAAFVPSSIWALKNNILFLPEQRLFQRISCAECRCPARIIRFDPWTTAAFQKPSQR
jgi:hypothetical protein